MTTIEGSISVVITAHDEGKLAHRSVRGALRSVRAAQRLCGAELRIELIAVLDAPTADTVAYFDRHAAHFSRIHRVAFKDRGLARNYGVERAAGRYIAFLTATDLVSENWLAAAHEQARSAGEERAVYHPQFSLLFGQHPKLIEHLDQRHPGFETWNLFSDACWTGLSFATRELLLEVPYAPAPAADGWGHADWHWNCEAIAAGATHQVVPGTVHFLRGRDDASQQGRAPDAARLMPPTRLWDLHDEADSSSRIATASQSKSKRSDRWTNLGSKMETLLRAQLYDRPRLRAAVRRINSAARAFNAARTTLACRDNIGTPLPDWLVAEWRAQHEIEPALRPTADRGAAISRHRPTLSAAAHVYRQATGLWQPDRTHVFLLPWMKRGGSDLVVLHQMRALAELGCDRQLCLTTEACDSPWLSELPPRTAVLEFGKLAAHLTDEARLQVLSRLLVQRNPSHVHCINSALGLKLYARHGAALMSMARLFASMWCPDYSVEGYGGYAFEYLPAIFPHLTGVFCDNRRFVDELVETYDFERARFQVLDFPTRVTVRPRTPASVDRLQVLWASRLDRQKRPDVLLRIIEACRTLPIDFHIFGAPALEANRYPARLRACPHVTYHGEYDGFGSLATEQFDAFLYTTAWDGLPNVLMEAMGAGLVCVAPDVGGISELLSGDNGYLVSGTEAVDEYARVLDELCQNRDRVKELRRLGPEYIARHRNWARFVEQVRSNRLYATPGAMVARVAA
ncbi:MAG TPA: glycosyltransferase [Pirellulales bacterium]|nr:glycosyltransferase [Pirellulales bacterium]